MPRVPVRRRLKPVKKTRRKGVSDEVRTESPISLNQSNICSSTFDSSLSSIDSPRPGSKLSDSSRPESSLSYISIGDVLDDVTFEEVSDGPSTTPDPMLGSDPLLCEVEVCSDSIDQHSTTTAWEVPLSSSYLCTNELTEPTEETETLVSDTSDRDVLSPDHTYAVGLKDYQSVTAEIDPIEMNTLLYEACQKMSMFLHKSWICHVSDGGIHVLLLSRKLEKSIQRRIFFTPSGKVTLSVHCAQVSIEKYLTGVASSCPQMSKDTLNAFVDGSINIVNAIRQLEICAGMDSAEYEHVWKHIASAKVDSNPYQECRYSKTLRSLKCGVLVHPKKWRCSECQKLRQTVVRRAEAFDKEEAHPFTPNIALSDAQKMQKLQKQQREVCALNRRIERLKEKMQHLLAVEGVHVSEDISGDLQDILKSQDLSPAQSLFLQQQLSASKAKGPSGVRWHPSMIRLALAMYMASPSCYQAARDSGMIKLPSQRTLFDYTHVNPTSEGIVDAVLENISMRLEKCNHPYQKYHVIMCDEMHICKNLVYKKSTGDLVGYVKLNEAFADIAALENFFTTGDTAVKPELATKMLSFMVKGVANDVKEVVASFSVNRLTTDLLYTLTWDVINRCERSGIAIIVFVSDGYTVNRSFMRRHKALNVTKSGLIYGTINKSAPDRPLFFMSDVAHLIKTIRNCLNNSRLGPKAKRCLQKGGQKLLWQPIIDLYNSKKHRNLLKSYKLTAQHVFIDSYSQMKVGFAAQTLSNTVAKDVEDMQIPGTSELVKFIRLVNEWFDCLNGAFSTQGIRTRNPNLNPYKSKDDSRFVRLEAFLQYLSDWKEEVYGVQAALNMTDTFQGPENVSFEPIAEEERMEDDPSTKEPETKASKKLLASQTLEGIEFTTMAFIGAVQFLIGENVQYVNARVFSQDHLEQHFSKQRHKSGGSANPTVGKFLQNNTNIHVQGQIGVRKRKGNTEDRSEGMVITNDPLPKRKRVVMNK